MIQLLALALVLPVLDDITRIVLLVVLIAAHPTLGRSVLSALVRARWLLFALTIAASLPMVSALWSSGDLSVQAVTVVATTTLARLMPITLLIVAVTVWVTPHGGEELSAAINSLLRPLRSLGVDTARAGIILTGTLAAIPETLARVQQVRARGDGHLDALAALVRQAETSGPGSLPMPGVTSRIPRSALILMAAWIAGVTAVQAMAG
jgi:hypothetical protein